jgi:hypothetical protein
VSSARSLQQALADSPAAALVRRVTDSQRVAAALTRTGVSLPPSFDALQPGACEVREATLVLFVGSPALAAKMRQSLPQLLASLNRQGFDLTEIKVRLQPERMSYREVPGADAMSPQGPGAPAALAEAPLHIAGALALAEKLALTLPGTAVGQAAQRLATRLRHRLAQTG